MNLTATTLRSIADALEQIEDLGSIGINSITINGNVISLGIKDDQKNGRTVTVTDIKPQFSGRN